MFAVTTKLAGHDFDGIAALARDARATEPEIVRRLIRRYLAGDRRIMPPNAAGVTTAVSNAVAIASGVPERLAHFTIALDPDEIDRLTEMAEADGRTVDALVCLIVIFEMLS